MTIWPNFIKCLMTSPALMAILWANSATVMVSGTWTSSTRASTGAADTASSRSRSLPRRFLGPPRQLLRPTPPLVSPRVGMAFFLAGSPAQLEDSLADLTSLLALGADAPGAAAGLGAALVPAEGVFAGLCKVPLVAALASTLGSSFLATSTFLGALIMARIASASAIALLRRSFKSKARAASSSDLSLDSAAAWSMMACLAAFLAASADAMRSDSARTLACASCSAAAAALRAMEGSTGRDALLIAAASEAAAAALAERNAAASSGLMAETGSTTGWLSCCAFSNCSSASAWARSCACLASSASRCRRFSANSSS